MTIKSILTPGSQPATRAAKASHARAAAAEARKAQGAPVARDHVRVSGSTAELAKRVAEAAAAPVPGADPKRLKELKRAIDEGRFDADPRALAEAILAEDLDR